jgi:hypothetical protein
MLLMMVFFEKNFCFFSKADGKDSVGYCLLQNYFKGILLTSQEHSNSNGYRKLYFLKMILNFDWQRLE